MSDISKREYEEVKKDLGSALKRMANIKEEMKESLGYVRQTMEIGLTAFAASWALARWGTNGEVHLMGIPVELRGALVLKGVAFSGLLDGYSGDAHSIGDGLLAVYLVKKGLAMGSAKGTSASGGASYAQLPQHAASSGAALTDAQLAAQMAY